MDYAREKSIYRRYRARGFIALLLTVILSLGFWVSGFDFTSRRIERDTLLISAVLRGDLDVIVSANGQLRSLEIELISTEVEGRVDKVLVDPGDKVTAGQVIIRLSNPNIIVAAEENATALAGGRAELQAARVNLENRLLDQEVAALRAKFAYEKEILKLEAETLLHLKNVISDIDFKQRQLSVEQLQQTAAIEAKRLKQSRNNLGASLAVKTAKVKLLEGLVTRANIQLENLDVRAGISGIVQSLVLENGQQLKAGLVVGEIAVPGLLYAELKVNAHQVNEIRIDQAVVIDTRKGRVDGLISRIDPRVSEGSVLVDVILTADLPNGARPQLNIEGLIYIERLTNVLYVGKPAFVRENDEVNFYKLDASEQYANRVGVILGKSTVDNVEVKRGLREGDKVILSDSRDWLEQEKIMLD